MAINKGTALRHDLKELMDQSVLGEIEFFADVILPKKSVTEKSGNVPVLSTSVGMKSLDVKRNKDGSFKRAEWVYGTDNYQTYQYGYEETVDNIEKQENSDYFNEEVIATAVAMNQMKLARESRMVAAVQNTTTFAAAGDKLSLTNEWDDATNATPFTDVTNIHTKLFTKIGIQRSQITLIMNEIVNRNGMRSDEVSDNLKYTVPLDLMSDATRRTAFAQYLGVKNIIIVPSFIDGTLLGVEDAEFARLWSNEYMMACVLSPSADSWKTPGLGRRPTYTKVAGDFWVESYDDDEVDGTVIRVREYAGEYVNAKYGVLVDNMTT